MAEPNLTKVQEFFMGGVIQVMGAHDVGKTRMLLQFGYRPEDIVFIDDDVKGQGIASSIPGLKYIDGAKLRSEAGLTQYWRRLEDEIKKLPTGLGQIAVDTWNEIYRSMRAYVENNKSEFKEYKLQIGTSKIIQGKISRAARAMETRMLKLMLSKANTVLIASHLVDEYKNNAATGLLIPETSKIFDKIPQMRVWLVLNPENPVPTALFLKRIGIDAYVHGKGIRTTNVLPFRRSARDSDESVWDYVNYYLRDPFGKGENAKPGEKPSKEEFGIIRGVLSSQQEKIWMMAIEANKALDEILAEPPSGGVTASADSVETPDQTAAEIIAEEPDITAPRLAVALRQRGFSVTPIDATRYLREYKENGE